jgi:hypothetical protein
MERIVQYVKDRSRDFDDYIPCKKERCDKTKLDRVHDKRGVPE